jgi:antitoxin (DNA-binding transcriptional repressor) of toxin-antitoxin stability system
MCMAKLKTVGIRELKTRISEYLREVHLGTTVLVTDRGVVIAEIGKPDRGAVRAAETSLIAGWIEQGRVGAPLSTKKPLAPTSIRLADGASRALLDQERGT